LFTSIAGIVASLFFSGTKYLVLIHQDYAFLFAVLIYFFFYNHYFLRAPNLKLGLRAIVVIVLSEWAVAFLSRANFSSLCAGVIDFNSAQKV
jgi:hypothetical protein